MKDKMKLFFLELGGFFASIAPLAVVVALNHERYVQSIGDAVKLGAGGVIVVVLILLKVIGKFKMPSDVVAVSVMFVLAVLLDAVLRDLSLLCGMYLIGSLLDTIFFKRHAKKLREKIKLEKQADATADRVEQIVQNYVGNGRV